MSRFHAATRSDAIHRATRSIRRSALSVLFFSGIINLLYLTGSLFMLQVYDRVLTSRSIPTLVVLALVTAGLYVFQGLLDGLRQRIVARLGMRFERELVPQAFEAMRLLTLAGRQPGEALAPMRDLDTLRSFVGSSALISLFDLPWLPIYLGFVFLLHPVLGYMTVAGALMLIALTGLTELRSKRPSKALMELSGRRQAFAEAARRNAEAMQAMGFSRNFYARYSEMNESYLQTQVSLADTSARLGSAGKIIRMILQSASLGVAAYLTIQGELSAGSIIAANIVSGRALAPIDLVIGQWKNFMAARQARSRLYATLSRLPDPRQPVVLSEPRQRLTVEDLTAATPDGTRMILSNVSFELRAGDGLALIGPSGAGKSTLARAIVGAGRVMRGAVRLDGAPLDQFDERDIGRYVGYLPQNTDLIDGTIAENISRFDPDATDDEITEAGRLAGIHDMVLRFADGYNTKIGDSGAGLSGGQRQRICLARALFRMPFLVVLDEPASNLDAEGDMALMHAIAQVRDRGGIVIMIAHRPSALSVVNLVGVLQEGALTHFGPADKVMQDLNAASQAGRPPRTKALNS